MECVNRILEHPLYKEYLCEIKKCEENRIFCKHDMVHFLDVCRLAEIEWLRYQMSFGISDNKDTVTNTDCSMRNLIYAAGLLHDIGRFQEYQMEIRHEIASSQLARSILEDCGFKNRDIEEILTAILNHRNKSVMNENTLSGFLYRADKKSRACFACEAESECNWSIEKKNMKLI